MLKLRRGVVVTENPLAIEIDGERRPAWADRTLVGPCRSGDEVIVNVAAIDLGLGSGGFDVVHANLTRGLDGGDSPAGVHVMKLNYTSLQHPVDPIEPGVDSPLRCERRIPLAVIPLHGHLAPLVWAASHSGLDGVGFIQGAGAALPGSLSRDVAQLRERGLLAGHVTAGHAFGGEHEAIGLIGAIQAAADRLGWSAAIVGPGPGILGSETRYGHGGMAALDAVHAGLALQLPVMLSPRLSASDPRPRHRGISHHTRSVLELALGELEVALPAGHEQLWPKGAESATAMLGRHRAVEAEADLAGYGASGLPRRTMGRDLDEDPLFFAAPLAAGSALAALAGL